MVDSADALSDLPVHPALRGHFAVDVLEGEGVLLNSERQSLAFSGRLYEQLAPLLNGESTVEDIVDQLSHAHPPEEVYFALLQLSDHGLLRTSANHAATREVVNGAFWDSVGNGLDARARVDSFPLSVVSRSEASARAWQGELQRHGFRFHDAAKLTIAIVDDYFDPILAEWNRNALQTGRPWLLCRPAGTILWIGPLFSPGQTACWECLRHRLRRNRPVEMFLLSRRESGVPIVPDTAAPWTNECAIGLVATQLARLLASDAPWDLADTITTIDTVKLEVTRHAVTRRPQCPACGDASLDRRRLCSGIVLRCQPKKFTADGGHRVISPDETTRQLSRLIDPLTGVIGDLRRLQLGNEAIYVYAAGHNWARPHHDLTGLRKGVRTSNGGKGFSDAQARASALGEAVERYSGVFGGDEPRIRTSMIQLGECAIHPDRCMLFSPDQYDTRVLNHGTAGQHDVVPEPFDVTVSHDWTPLWSLSEHRMKYLPTGLLYYGYPIEERVGVCAADSNGNAAGNTIEEAILQGFLELVERDSTALWWYNRAVRPALDLTSFDAPGWSAIHEFYLELGREIWVLDITSDFSIPVFVAVSCRKTGAGDEILLGLGAHLEARLAVMRAISEMNQMLPALESRNETGRLDGRFAAWLREATLENQPYLVPAQTPVRQLADYPRLDHDDLRDDIMWCQRAVEAKGLELLVLDQTRADVDLPVVKVVVPGLRHFRPRFASGRLYDVPANLGWLQKATAEAALNPVPFFL